MASKEFILPIRDSVEEQLLGLVMENPNLLMLNNSKTIIRKDHESLSKKVKIISGGGSGHEPAQAGFVGSGFLTGSVSGEIFASPSSSEIFRAITKLGSNHKPGILLIVLNYTGDRLNFGLAMERARSQNIKVEMCVVDDDCAIKDYVPSVGRRGLAGSILINKIAGALTEIGWCLEDIAKFINKILKEGKLRTIGISVNNDKVELGKGMHGEPGAMFLNLDKNDYASMVKEMLEILNLPEYSSDDVIILVNNLGGYKPHEILLIRNDIFHKLSIFYKSTNKNNLVRIYCGKYLTSLNLTGFSITIMKADKLILECIDYNSDCYAWNDRFITLDMNPYHDVFIHDEHLIQQKKYVCHNPKLSEKGSEIVGRSLSYLSEALVSCTRQLNIIDSEVGDGDTGSTISRGATEILKLLQNKTLNTDNPEITLKQISHVAEEQMGGTSGALYSIFFQAAALSFKTDSQPCNLASWLLGLKAGNKAIQTYGLSKAGDRTMLDPLLAVEKSLSDSVQNNMPNFKALELATEAAEKVAQLTATMTPHAGRAVYSSKSIQTQYPDAGAHAVGIWMRAICEAVRTLKSGPDYI